MIRNFVITLVSLGIVAIVVNASPLAERVEESGFAPYAVALALVGAAWASSFERRASIDNSLQRLGVLQERNFAIGGVAIGFGRRGNPLPQLGAHIVSHRLLLAFPPPSHPLHGACGTTGHP